MNPPIAVFLFSFMIGIIYMLIYTVLFFTARKKFERDSERTLYVYAKVDSLEYDLRCALMAAGFENILIVVNIPKNDKDFSEMLSIVRYMRRKHKNITYKITG